jgi:hypothetical protein
MMNVSRGAIQRINENDAEAATGANFIMQVLYCDDHIETHPANTKTAVTNIVKAIRQQQINRGMRPNHENSAIITKLTDIIAEGVEDNAEMELGIFKLKTKIVKDISKSLIKV